MSTASTWCLCRGRHPHAPDCQGWLAYVDQHLRLHHRNPTAEDVKLDQLLLADETERDLARAACGLFDHLWFQPDLEAHAVGETVAEQCRRCGSVRHDADAAPLSDNEAAAFLALVQSYAKEAPTS